MSDAKRPRQALWATSFLKDDRSVHNLNVSHRHISRQPKDVSGEHTIDSKTHYHFSMLNWIEIGQRLASRRKALKLTQSDVGAEFNSDHTYVSRIERGLGKPTLEILDAISNILEVSLGWLIDGEPTPSFSDDVKEMLKQPRTLQFLEILGSLSEDEELIALRMLNGLMKVSRQPEPGGINNTTHKGTPKENKNRTLDDPDNPSSR